MNVYEKVAFFLQNDMATVMVAFRQREGLTQGELGQLLGKSAATIERYETRKRDIPQSVSRAVEAFWHCASTVKFKPHA